MTEQERKTIAKIIESKPFIKKMWSGAMAFDIETSSFYYRGLKAGCMYLWAFAVDEYAITGRTWKEFLELIDFLKDLSSKEKRFQIFVHNLSYEFQWICKKFNWSYVFALSKREVASACTGNIVFKCSLLLSGLSLAKTAEKYNKNHRKLTEIADYKSIRTPETVLTDNDYKYVKEDVLCVTEYINTQIERYKDPNRIPMTSTGAVRDELRKHLFPEGKYNNEYARLMQGLTLESDEYRTLKKAYMGGFTHANWHWVGRVMDAKDRGIIRSFDFTSSYPASMLLFKNFPIAKGIHVKFKEEYLKKFCCIITFRVKNVSEKFYSENFMSLNKTSITLEQMNDENFHLLVNNGRIREATEFEATMTELDFEIFNKCYKYDSIEYLDCWIYKKGYLPKPFMEYILFLYKQKTELKDVEGMEVFYNLYKAFLNSLYGILVEDRIGRPEVNYSKYRGWEENKRVNIEARKDKYNASKKRFTYYPWGVYTASIARHNLWQAIFELGDDYLYSDTDSVKIMHYEDHKGFFESYDEGIIKKIQDVCEYYGFNPEDFSPKTIKGEPKTIGVWDNDHNYTKFKTLGAKRYLVENEKDSSIECTIAGLPKLAVGNFGEDPFKFFDRDMYLDEEDSLKNLVTYCDQKIKGRIRDVNGKLCNFEEDSFVHIEGTTFMLGIGGFLAQVLNNQFRIGASA